MRPFVVRGAVLIGLGCLAACSNAPRASTSTAQPLASSQHYGSLAVGDNVGRAAFRSDKRGEDRLTSVPISID